MWSVIWAWRFSEVYLYRDSLDLLFLRTEEEPGFRNDPAEEALSEPKSGIWWARDSRF